MDFKLIVTYCVIYFLYLHCSALQLVSIEYHNDETINKYTYTVKKETVENYPLHDSRVLGREILTSVKIHCNATCYFTLAM